MSWESVWGAVADNVLGGFYNKKAASKSQEYAYDMTDYVNDYNSPANQMLRLKEAGLNPNLVYASGVNNTSSGNQGATLQPYRPNYTQALLSKYQVDLAEAQLKAQNIQNKIADQDLKVYEDIGIRPGTSGLSDIARLLTNPKAVKKIKENGKQLLQYVWDSVIGSSGDPNPPSDRKPKGSGASGSWSVGETRNYPADWLPIVKVKKLK